MNRVRVAAVGTGGIFSGAHLSNYHGFVDDCQLVALCDVNEASAKRALARLKSNYEEAAVATEEAGDPDKAKQIRDDADSVAIYTDHKTLIKKSGPDLVDLCTPPAFHANLAIELLDLGVNVMCEKPMAVSYLDCLEVVKAVDRTGKFYQHNENWLYDGSWYGARKAIDAGLIGEVQLMFLATAHGGPESVGWFWNPEIAGGGSLLDNGIHALTTSWYLAGFDRQPAKVKAADPQGISVRMKKRIIDGRYQDVVVEDDAHILIQYEDKVSGAWATAHVEGSWSHRDSIDTIIIGTTGTITFTSDDGRSAIKITDPFDNSRLVHTSGGSSFGGEIRNMVSCVREGVAPICDEHIGATSTALVGCAYLSEKRGRKAVTLAEFTRWAEKIRQKEGANASKVLVEQLLSGIS